MEPPILTILGALNSISIPMNLRSTISMSGYFFTISVYSLTFPSTPTPALNLILLELIQHDSTHVNVRILIAYWV